TSWNAALMPVNVVQPDGTGLISTMFDGIIYAASNGADIINLSLGRAIDGGPPLNSEQEMINLATDFGTLVVSSAGNRGNATPQYPSSYKNVLSVAATTNDDIKTSFSNYGITVDIAAPGVDIQSTLNKGEYGIIPFGGSSGTSFSSPIVAGVAALVKTQHPDWLPIQVGEQVRVTADDIDALNPTFAGLLGGRVNALRAVTETNVPSLRIANMIINDTNGNGVIQPGENIEVLLNFVNYLAPAANVNLTLQTNDRFVTLVKNSATIASLGTLDTTSTPVSFEFQVSTIAPSGRALNFIIDIANGTYQDKERINLVVEPTFGTVAINNVDVSLTNLGRIGFADPSNSLGGIGFKFNNGPNLLFEGAIIAGTGPNRISNAARGLLIGGTNLLFNQDFSSAEGGDLQINTPGLITDQESFAILQDDKSNTPMDLRITQESFAVTAPPNDDFILLRYTIANEGQNSLENFHFGFFFDWDIDEANPDNVQRNLANYDAARNLGYVSFSTTFVGAAIVSSDANVIYTAIDNAAPDFGVYDGFSDLEKWQAISGGIQSTRKGPSDVSHVIATGPFAIEPNGTIQMGLALLAGTGFQDLQANADAAKAFWESLFTTDVADEPIPGIPTEFVLRQNYPNPFNPTTTIRYEIPEVRDVELTIHNLLGQKIRTFKERQNAGTYSIQWDGKNEAGKQVASGVYLYRITAGEFKQTRKMLLLR
ncbi:MAG: S8 family serine peptidase, partial [bacterium]